MRNSIFITGTDTGVGKTVVAGLLWRSFLERGVRSITQKWVQTGCECTSEDIAAHVKISGCDDDFTKKRLQDMAPYVLEFPASPHLAASLANKNIDPARIQNSFRRLEENFDTVIVEGSGGLMVPVNDKDLMIDIAEKLSMKILVVSKNRVGAINQTLLTIEALNNRSMPVAGIIFNRLSKEENELIMRDNMRIVEKLSGVKVLGELPYSENVEELYDVFQPIGEKLVERETN